MGVKYPEITVQLSGRDGHALSVIAAVTKAMKEHGVPKDDIRDFVDEVMDGDYDHLLQTAMKTVNVE